MEFHGDLISNQACQIHLTMSNLLPVIVIAPVAIIGHV